MYEEVEELELIKGEKYYVKRPNRNNIHGIFNGSDFEGFVWFKIDNEMIELDTELFKVAYYRCVSKEEYYAKVKDKYDEKCLNIILKRLIDESFEWPRDKTFTY